MKLFIDSSVIIEGLKGNQEALELVKLLLQTKLSITLHINSTVFSEVVYQLYYKQKFTLDSILNFISKPKILSEDKNVVEIAKKLIKIYKLKPNDALILATCKHHGIPYLISLDSDFIEPCEREGIVLINSPAKLKEILSKST